jgi:hypothetical protein
MSINKPVYINPAQGGGTTLPTYVTGQYLTNNGTTLSWAANGMGDLLANGTVPLTANWAMGAFELSQATWKGVAIAAGYGGTGLASYAVGDILHATGTTTVGKLADVAVGQVLASGGVGAVPAYTASPTLTGDLTASNLTATPTLSAEALTNVAGWTAAGSWTYAAGTIWSHATGNATALTATGETAIVAGTNYEIVMVLTTSTAGGGLIVSLGGQSFGTVSASGSYTFNVAAASTAALAITPTSGTWVGSLTISVKLVTNGQLNAEGITQNSGQLLLPNGNVSYPSFAFSKDANTGIYYTWDGTSSGAINIAADGVRLLKISASGTSLQGAGYYLGLRIDASRIYSGADYVFDFRNGTNPNTLNVYNTYTSSTSYERAFLRTTATAVEIGSEKGSGGGTARPVGIFTDGIERITVDTSGNVAHLGLNAQATNIRQATVVVTTTAAATATATNLIPAGSFVIGVTTRVTTAVTGDAGFTGFNVGETDADRWGANVSPLLNATTDLTNAVVTAPIIFTAATSVVLTQVGGSTFSAGGVVRVTVHYISLTAPTT